MFMSPFEMFCSLYVIVHMLAAEIFCWWTLLLINWSSWKGRFSFVCVDPLHLCCWLLLRLLGQQHRLNVRQYSFTATRYTRTPPDAFTVIVLSKKPVNSSHRELQTSTSRPWLDLPCHDQRCCSYDCLSKSDEGKFRFFSFIVEPIGKQSIRGVVPNQKGGSCVSFSRRQN